MEITYELLFEALMLEKNRPELQKLDPEFYKALAAYVRDKKKILEERKEGLEFFSVAEKEKTSKQLSNIRKMTTELYERREKKIIEMALTRSRTGSTIMDTSPLLEEEKLFFDEIIGLLDRYRTKTVSIIESKDAEFAHPKIQVQQTREDSQVTKKIEKDIEREDDEDDDEEDEEKEDISNIRKEINQKNKEEDDINQNKIINKEDDLDRNNNMKNEDESTKVIRFIHAVPRFLGKDLEVYGPFEEEDIATIPSDIAEVIIRKGRAEEMR